MAGNINANNIVVTREEVGSTFIEDFIGDTVELV
jgi:hypothetical protein